MSEKDPLMRLAKLALHADPRVRDSRKIEKQLKRKPSTCDVIRCVCFENVEKSHHVCCDVCNCWCHEQCVGQVDADPNSTWICPFCENSELTKDLIKEGVDIPKLTRSIFDMQRRAKDNLFAKSAENLYYSKTRMNQITRWIGTLTQRDDVYHNIFKASTKCMNSSDSTTCTKEIQQERNSLRELAQEMEEITGELAELKTPIMDGIIENIIEFLPPKDHKESEDEEEEDQQEE